MPSRPPPPSPSAESSDLRPGSGAVAQLQEQRRRQVRKGTRSCWECKRRKVRCRFDLAVSRDACRSCHRRGAACVGQEFSEETSRRKQPQLAQDTGGRLQRLEALLGHMLGGGVSTETATTDGRPAAGPAAPPKSRTLEQELTYDTFPRHVPNITDLPAATEPTAGTLKRPTPLAQDHCIADERLSAISQKLVAKLPSEQDCVTIFRVGGIATYYYQQIVAGSFDGPWKAPAPDFCVAQITDLKHTMHPALLAKAMLGMAGTLQRVRPPAGSLSENAGALQKRLADAAISLVCNDDYVMNTVEALECLVMQVAYLFNGGNLQLSLLACRRAITVSQLMGLHQSHNSIHVMRVDLSREVDPRCIWFGIVYMERLICLLLGVPDTARDMNNSGAGDFSSIAIGNSPLAQLQRAHSIVASRIIQRNHIDPSFERSRQESDAIDLELARAAALMAPRWWAVPRLEAASLDDIEFFWEMNRLFHHLVHQFLLVQLHLPFMLRSSRDPQNLAIRATCTNASRNTLTRFVAAGSVRELAVMPEAVDLFALVAAVVLLLAHIDDHRLEGYTIDTSLRHQRPTDRALLQDTLDFMRINSLRSSDMLSRRSSDVLKRLLEIEEHAAAGQRYTTSPGSSMVGGGSENDKDWNEDHRYFRLKIPYYGILIIHPDLPVTRAPVDPAFRLSEHTVHRHAAALEAQSHSISSRNKERDNGNLTVRAYNEEATTVTTGPAEEAPSAIEDGFLGRPPSGPMGSAAPGLGTPLAEEEIRSPSSISTAVDDWALQSIDGALFDTIMS